MRLTKKISAIVLALALLISCMGVFTVSAATDTVMNLVSFRDSATGYASYDYSATYTDASWRMYFYGDASATDIYEPFGGYVVTWDNGGVTGQSVVDLYPQDADNGTIWAVIWGVPAADTLVDGATVKIAAGTGTTSSGNSITLARDVDMKWHADTQTWEYIAPAPAYTGNALALSSSNAGSGFYASSEDSIPYNADWLYRYFPVGTQGEITLIRNGVETKLPNAYFQKISASSYYINVEAGGVPAQEGDTIRVSGIFALGDWTKAWAVGWFPGTYVEVQESTFDFDGTNWSAGHVVSDDAVVLTHLDVIAAHQSATAFYTSFPEGTTGLTIDNNWYTRFYPMTNQDGGFVNGTAYANRFALDSGGGMPIQSAAGAAGLYVTGFGTATEGTTVTIMGNFYGYNRNTGVMTGEEMTLYAPVTFTYDGSTWTRTSEIPTIPVTYDNLYSGTLTTVGAQTTGAAHQLYLKGDAGLDLYKVNVTDWSVRLTVAMGDDNGVFLNGTKVTGGSLFKYGDANNYWFAEGFTATTGDVITIKGDFVNNTQSAKVTISECKFQWNGSKWIDYIDWNYHDFTVSGLNQMVDNLANEYRHFYLNIDGEVPGDWDKFDGLKAAVNGGEKFDIRVGNNGTTSVICFDLHVDYMAEDIAVGTKLTVYAGEATPVAGAANVAADDAIRLTEDFTLVWDGTAWVSEEDYNPYTYTDLTITGAIAPSGLNTNSSRWDFYLSVDGTIPGVADSGYSFTPIKAIYKDADGNTILEKDFTFTHAAHGNGTFFAYVKFTELAADALSTGSRVTFYAGKADPTTGSEGINIVSDFMLEWNGSEWAIPDTTVYEDVTLSRPDNGWNSDKSWWDIYLTSDIALPGTAWTTLYKDIVVEYGDGATVTSLAVKKSGDKQMNVFFRSDAPSAGTKVTIKAGTSKAYDNSTGEVDTATNGINIVSDYVMVWTGTELVPEADYNPTTYYDFSVSGINQVLTTLYDTGSLKYRHFYLNIDGEVPGSWDKFEGLKVAVNGGEKFDIRVGNNGSTSVICFDLHVDYMAEDIAVGTKLTVYAGEATPVAGAPNVASTDVIRLTADYTIIWNGTAWVSEADYVVYNDITLTGTVYPTGYSSTNSRWDFYMSVDGTIPGVGDSGYYFTPAYVTVVDGSGNALLNKLEKDLTFAAHQTTLYFNLDATTLPYASVTEGSILTVHAGKMDPLSRKSVATNEDGYKLGINVLNDLVLIWDGASWVTYVDRSDYTVYEGSVSTKGAEVEPSTPPHLYLQGSDTLDPVMKDVATAWNKAYVYPMLGSDNGVFLNGSKISVNFQKYNGTNNRWYMASITPSAEGDTLVIKGQFYNDTYKVIVDLSPLTLVWDGSQWVQRIIATVEKDVNGDDVVDIRDAVLLQKHLADTSVVVSNMSDINESGSVTSDDQRVLRRYLLGIVLTYVNDIPVGTPYYAGGEMVKVAYIPPAIGTIDWDTETVTFNSDDEIDRVMDDYAAAGFTHINPEFYGYYYNQAANWWPQQLLYRYFEEAEERGLKVIVTSQYINMLLQTSQDIDTYDSNDSTQINLTNWRAVVDHIISTLDDYPAFWGFMMADEPSSDEVANYLKVVPYIHENHPTVGTYWASYPKYVTSTALGSYTYEEYVTALGAGTGYFMYDSYCLVNKDTWYGSSNNYIDQYWFSNLNLVAELGRDKNFTSGITMQSTALTPSGGDGLFSNTYQRRQITSDADIGFQVYTALAYGFKELSYFTYSDHPNADVVSNTSMIGTDGTTKNAAYYAVQNTHAEIKGLEAALVNYNWLGTIELNLEDSDDQTSTYTAANNDRLASVSNSSGALVIGCMKDVDGYDGYLVANASEPSKSSTSSVTLTFNNATKALVYINGVAQEVTLTNGSYTVSVADGEGVFIVPILEG